MSNSLNDIAIREFGSTFETAMDLTPFDTVVHSMLMAVKESRGLHWYNSPRDAVVAAQNLYCELYDLRANNKLTEQKHSVRCGYFVLSAGNYNGKLRLELFFNYSLSLAYQY